MKMDKLGASSIFMNEMATEAYKNHQRITVRYFTSGENLLSLQHLYHVPKRTPSCLQTGPSMGLLLNNTHP
jgi:hypothetical protein